MATSSSFPAVFSPLVIDESEGINRVALFDGGVSDNLGVNPLLRTERNNLDYAIVSDVEKSFELDKSPTNSSAMVLVEAIDVLMEQQVRG